MWSVKDRAKRALVAVASHYKRINFHDTRERTDVELQKSNIMIITGSGKALAQTARSLNVPFTIAD